jgi:hypothetical protein
VTMQETVVGLVGSRRAYSRLEACRQAGSSNHFDKVVVLVQTLPRA